MTAPDAVVISAPTRPAGPSGSYWSVVAGQLRKNRTAMVALALLKGLVVVAITAPLLAMNVPWLWHDAAGWRLPLVESLFDRFLFPSGVDVFFNLLLLATPVWWLAVRATRAWSERRAGGRSWRLALRVAALAIVLAVEMFAFVGARSAYRFAFLGVVLPGAAALAWAQWRRDASPRTSRRARLACVGLVVLGLVGILRGFVETSPWRDWRLLSREPACLAAVFPPVPYHPDNVGDSDPLNDGRNVLPGYPNLLGCDTNLRDVASRLLFGTRISLTIGVVAVSIYVLIGILLGGLAGFYGGWVDLTISRLIEVMICFPTLFLILTVIAVFGTRSIFLIMAAIGLVGWPGVARLVRGEFLRQRNLDYVTAAVSQGVPERRIIFGHVLPNCLGPVLVSATFGVAGAILTESGLAFLGLGDTSATSWGQMLTLGRESLYWHLILVPGFAIFFVVTVFNLLGEGLRDALDPKLRR